MTPETRAAKEARAADRAAKRAAKEAKAASLRAKHAGRLALRKAMLDEAGAKIRQAVAEKPIAEAKAVTLEVLRELGKVKNERVLDCSYDQTRADMWEADLKADDALLACGLAKPDADNPDWIDYDYRLWRR